MLVYVIADIDGNDLVYRFAGHTFTTSGLYRQKNKGSSYLGNPGLVYGPDAAAYLLCDKKDLTYIVAMVKSGQLHELPGESDGPDDADKASV